MEQLRKAKVRARRRWWVKPWVSKRGTRGASSTLLREWALENPEDYRNHLRMSEAQFSFLLERVTPLIEEQDTRLRLALTARIKLQMTLRYLATGDNLGTLSALYRVPRSTFSLFFPVVCRAIYRALEEFIQVTLRSYARGILILSNNFNHSYNYSDTSWQVEQ